MLDRPAVRITREPRADMPYAYFSVDDADVAPDRLERKSPLDALRAAAEDFAAQQDRREADLRATCDTLDERNAAILIDYIDVGDIETLALADSDLAVRWAALFETASVQTRAWARNAGLALVPVLARDDPDRALVILNDLISTEGFAQVGMGDGLTLEHQAVWSMPPTAAVLAFWRMRIHTAADEVILSREVRAAERFGAARFVADYVLDGLVAPTTLARAYALMVAGYSERVEAFAPLIAPHVDGPGLVGDAARLAMDANRAAEQAQAWTGMMAAAEAAERFWLCLEIARSVIDIRAPKAGELLPHGHRWRRFAPIYNTIRERSVRDRDKIRRGKLFGCDAPERRFLLQHVSQR